MYDVCRVYGRQTDIFVHLSVPQCTVMGHLKYCDEYYKNRE
jgi:hypothetical protein